MTFTHTPESGYRTQSSDTSLEVEQIIFQRLRLLSLHEKAILTCKATRGCWRLSLIGIQNQYPNANPQLIRFEFIRRRLGIEWAEKLCTLKSEGELLIADPIWLALKIADILDAQGIPYLVGGSVASSLLGEARATLDLDLAVSIQLRQVRQLVDAMSGEFYISRYAAEDAVKFRSSFNVIHLDSTEKADIFVLGDDAFSQSKMSRRQPYFSPDSPERPVYIYTAEDIILQKLIWYRLSAGRSDRQWRDVLGVLKVQGSRLDFDYLTEWAQTLRLTELLTRAKREAGFES